MYAKPEIHFLPFPLPPSLLCLSLLGQSLTVILGMQFTSVRSPYYTVISHTRQRSRKPLTAFGQGSYNFRTFGDFRRVFCTASSVPYLGAMLPTSEWTNFKINFGILLSCVLCRRPISPSVCSAQVLLDLCKHLLEAGPFQYGWLLRPLFHQVSIVSFSPWLQVWELEEPSL